MDEYIEVICDESGNEGENLTRAGSRVFTHAGVSISKDDADDLMDYVRNDLGTKAKEIKSKIWRDPANQDLMKWLLTEPRLVNKANVHLTDKQYFIAGKIVDLLVEPVLRKVGHSIYSDGMARLMAHELFREGPVQLGGGWDTATDQFNTMLRATFRSGTPATLTEFYTTLDSLLPQAKGWLAQILAFVSAGESVAAELVASKTETAIDYLSLDPTFAALATIVRTWHEKSGLPVQIVHDETSLLTPQRIKSLIEGLADPAVVEVELEPVPLLGVTLVDSKSDSRVQVADLLAGAAHLVASDALAGKRIPLAAQLRPHVDATSLWAEAKSWNVLVHDPV